MTSRSTSPAHRAPRQPLSSIVIPINNSQRPGLLGGYGSPVGKTKSPSPHLPGSPAKPLASPRSPFYGDRSPSPMSLGGNSPFGVSAHVSNSGSPMQMSAGGTPSYGASPLRGSVAAEKEKFVHSGIGTPSSPSHSIVAGHNDKLRDLHSLAVQSHISQDSLTRGHEVVFTEQEEGYLSHFTTPAADHVSAGKFSPVNVAPELKKKALDLLVNQLPGISPVYAVPLINHHAYEGEAGQIAIAATDKWFIHQSDIRFRRSLRIQYFKIVFGADKTVREEDTEFLVDQATREPENDCLGLKALVNEMWKRYMPFNECVTQLRDLGLGKQVLNIEQLWQDFEAWLASADLVNKDGRRWRGQGPPDPSKYMYFYAPNSPVQSPIRSAEATEQQGKRDRQERSLSPRNVEAAPRDVRQRSPRRTEGHPTGPSLLQRERRMEGSHK